MYAEGITAVSRSCKGLPARRHPRIRKNKIKTYARAAGAEYLSGSFFNSARGAPKAFYIKNTAATEKTTAAKASVNTGYCSKIVLPIAFASS